MTQKRIIASVCIAAGILGWASLRIQAQADVTPPTDGTPADNPHWSAKKCGHCHTLRDGTPQAIQAVEIDTLCLGCHDGVRASKESHPIGRSFDNPQITLPADWPVTDGRLGCITCHQVRQACQDQPVRPLLNPAFLRSNLAPDSDSFCSQCHTATADSGRHNPHRMLAADGQVNQQACMYCHRGEMLNGEGVHRMGDGRFRMDPLLLCLGCHRSHVDYFEPGHIGVRPSAKILARIQALNSHNHRLETDATVARNVPDRSECASLPLSSDGRVICSTCHNPHQQGVFPDGSVMGCGARRLDRSDGVLPHRGLGQDLCGTCHAK